MFGVEDFSQKIVDFSNFEVSQLGDAFIFGGAVLLMGMVTIFAVLCLIWACLTLFKFFFHDLPKRKSAAAKAPADVKPVKVVEVAPAESSNDEIVAVIAAAIAMAESESDGLKFRVVSFKRK